MNKINSSLFIDGLELRVHLGWPDIERQHEQIVLLDIDIYFLEPPKGCVSDHLDDTMCYSSLINEIREKTAPKKFHLVEHLAYDIYALIKPKLPEKSRVNVRITKHPEVIAGLSGGVKFSYWDEVE